MFLEICLHCLWFPWQFPEHIISAKSISTIDEIVSLHLALHFYSIILLVKYSSKLIIHGHFLLLQGVAEQHCLPGEMEEVAWLAKRHFGAYTGRPQPLCYASQTQSQATELNFPGNKVCITLCSVGVKNPEFVDRRVNHTSFHLPYLPVFGSQLGPFEELFYLIKNKLTKI